MASVEPAVGQPLGRPGLPGAGEPALPRGAAEPPRLTLPTGGGSIRGMGESLEPVTPRGTCGFRIPLGVAPGRGLAPDLALVYSSGAGNSAFGLGWDVPLASVARKTERGLPRYADDDRFVLTGTDDLVVVEAETGPAPFGGTGELTWRTRYRARTEGGYVRVERHRRATTGEVYWATFSPANVLTLFGRSPSARVADPDRPERVFSWLPEDVFDDRGNHLHYHWVGDDARGVDSGAPEEAHRTAYAQRYLREIAYVNAVPVSDRGAVAPIDHTDPLWRGGFHVLVGFDYGDFTDPSTVDPDRDWAWRADRFSTYRPGFEVRTQRRCRRVRAFHRFPEQDSDGWQLVSATELGYDDDPVAARLTTVTQVGYDDAGSPLRLPPLTFSYRAWAPSRSLQTVPTRLDRPYQWIDLDADGAAGVLRADGPNWLYRANLGGGDFAPSRLVGAAPTGGPRLAAVFGDGRLAALAQDGTTMRYSVRDPVSLEWQAWQPFGGSPVVDWADRRLRQVDLDGDGRSDVLVHEAQTVVWHRFAGEDGWEPARRAATGVDERHGPQVVLDDPTAAVLFADMTGDGLDDVVRVRAGSVCYWPNLGYGRFGARVTMGSPPVLDDFDPARVRLSDVDGTGPADLVYLGPDGITYWPNRAGNSWGPAFSLAPLVAAATSVDLVDLLGRGTQCLVLSDTEAVLRYVDLMPEGRPGLLTGVDNGRGLRTEISYATSTEYALRDRRAGTPWSTHLPIPVQVVSSVVTTDDTTGVSVTTSYRYRDGYYDLTDREFRGFGRVEQADTDALLSRSGRESLPPRVSVTWYHTGCAGQELPAREVGEVWEPGTDERRHEALRSLRGKPLRTATYAFDGTAAARYPYGVTEQSYRLRLLDPAPGDPDGYAVVVALPSETVESHVERNPVADAWCYPDPALPPYSGPASPIRQRHTVAVTVNDLGQVERSLSVAYPRSGPNLVTTADASFGNLTGDPGHYRLGVALREAGFELLAAPAGRYDPTMAAALAGAPVVPDDGTAPVQPSRRKLSVVRHRYWDDAVGTELPDGSFGRRGALRRTLTAAATDRQVGLLAPEVAPGDFVTEGRYLALSDVDGEPLHWAQSAVVEPDPARFHQPVAFVDPFGLGTFVSYDQASVHPVEVLVTSTVPGPTWNRTTAVYDYRVLAPARVTDPHAVVSEGEYDALGALLRQRLRGPAGEGAPDGEWDREFAYHPWAWHDGRIPTWTQQRFRESYAVDSAWRRTVSYLTGTGKPLLAKAEAEPGPAPWYGDDGRLVFDGDGRPALRDTGPVRWLGTGRTVYDGKGRPVSTYDPYFVPDERYEDEALLVETGHPVVVRYDPVGRVVRTDFPDGTFDRVEYGPWQTVSWDRADTVLDSDWYQAYTDPGATADQKRAAQASAVHAGTPSVARVDALGRTVQLVERLGAGELVSTVDYDGAGRPVTVTDARGTVVARTTYDLLGQALVAVGADGGERRAFLDALGRPVRTYAGCAGWTANAAGFEVRVRTERDLFGRDRAVWAQYAPGADEVCRLVAGYGDDDPGYGAPRYLLGRAHQSFDGAGLTETLTADFAGNTTRTRRRFLAAYDKEPDWSAVAGAAWHADRAPAAGNLLEPKGFEEVADHDALRRPVRTTGVDGGVVEIVYGAGGLVDTVHVTPAGEARRVVVDAIGYDAKRRREQVDYGPGGTVAQARYEFDELTHRITRIRTVRQLQPLQDLTFGYDAMGNVLVVRDLAQATAFFRNSVVSPDREYTYDDLYRLTGATGRELSGTGHTTADASRRPPVRDLPDPNDLTAVVRYEESYTYDDGDNLTELRHVQKVNGGATWVRALTPSVGGNRLSATSVSGDVAGTDALGYDARGNLTTLGYLTFAWNWQDRPATAVVGGNVTAYYHYAADGSRVRKVVVSGAQVADRRYVGTCELDTVHVNGNLRDEARTLKVSTGDRFAALVELSTVEGGQPVQRSSVTRHQLGDQLDSTVLELDDTGNPLTYEEFHPFGTTAYESRRPGGGVGHKRYRFAAKERDEETGLSYHGARYYAPWLGRWVSPDPAGLADGTNRYAYARNSPVRRTDPGGRQSKPAETKKSPDPKVDDAGAPIPLPKPDYVDEGGEAVYVMTDEQRREQQATLPEGGTVDQEKASQGKVATTGGTEVKAYVRQEVTTGQKAALRTNPLVMGALSWGFLAMLVAGKPDKAAAILNSVSGPEPKTEIAQGSEQMTGMALALAEMSVFGGIRGLGRVARAAKTLTYTAEQLTSRAMEIHGEIINRFGLTGRAQTAFTVSVTQGRGVAPIVNVTNPKYYDAIKSGAVALREGEILGTRIETVEGVAQYHAEIQGVWDAQARGATGGVTSSSIQACGRCGIAFYSKDFPGWTHANPNPSHLFELTPREYFEPWVK